MNIAIKREQSGACIGSAEREQFGTKFKKTTNNFLRTAGLSLAAAAVALCGMTACTNDDNIMGDEPANGQPAAVKTYQVTIPATIGSDGQTRAVSFDGTTSTTTFKTTDKVYVYDKTQDLWASDGTHAVTLAPATDGQQTQLTGALKFSNSLSKDIAVGDVLHLYYNMNAWNGTSTSDFEYNPEGSATNASAHDFAEATMKIKSIDGNATDGYTLTLCQVSDETKGTAEFENLQSMFRQRLTFKNSSNETVTPTITNLIISSKNNKLVYIYRPIYTDEINVKGHVVINNPVIDANGDIYLALRFVGSDDTDALTFTATDDADNIYELTKAAPSGGFQNGKYYHGTMTLPFARKVNQPVVTGTSTTPDKYNTYDIKDDPTNITISGTSENYNFYLNKDATVILDGITATYAGNYIIYAAKNLNLVVNGANSFSSTGFLQPISASYIDNGTIKLSGNGTLTVTGTSSTRCGLYAKNYSNGGDVSALAATGYTVTRSERTDNSDGTYSWTYTVRPTFSVSSTQKVVFAPGNLQAVFAKAMTSSCTWQFAPTQYSCIGTATANTDVGNNVVRTAGTVDLFGWVGASSSLDAYGINWNKNITDYGNTAGEALKSDWSVAANAANLGGHNDWRTLTNAEWGYLFQTRTDASQKYGHGSVNDVNGMIILPDEWVLPAGLSFTPGNSAWTNAYTVAQWAQMEANGAVFLPAAGYRHEYAVICVGSDGYYWSSTSHVSIARYAHFVYFNSSNLNPQICSDRIFGSSVRLVRNAE